MTSKDADPIDPKAREAFTEAQKKVDEARPTLKNMGVPEREAWLAKLATTMTPGDLSSYGEWLDYLLSAYYATGPAKTDYDHLPQAQTEPEVSAPKSPKFKTLRSDKVDKEDE